MVASIRTGAAAATGAAATNLTATGAALLPSSPPLSLFQLTLLMSSSLHSSVMSPSPTAVVAITGTDVSAWHCTQPQSPAHSTPEAAL